MDGRAMGVLALLVTLAGCAGGSSEEFGEVRAAVVKANTDAMTARQEAAQLREQVEAMGQQIQALRGEVSQLQADQAVNESIQSSERVAFLQPGNDGYSLVMSDLGVLTVTIDDVQPYANGSRIVLKFGNPLATTINGLKAKLEWGRLTESGLPDPLSMKEKELTFSQSLPAGAWTSIPVVLEAVPPSSLGYVRVRQVAHTGISLRR